jgi:hypothetical protein
MQSASFFDAILLAEIDFNSQATSSIASQSHRMASNFTECFSSQRGPNAGGIGVTFEVRGPFRS